MEAKLSGPHLRCSKWSKDCRPFRAARDNIGEKENARYGTRTGAAAECRCARPAKKAAKPLKQKYGAQFYEEIGRKGGLATKQAHGHEFYEQIGKKGGKKGGEATRDRYGPNFYERIGQKGGQKVKQLIEEGKRAASERKQRAS